MISFIVIGHNEGWKLSKCIESVFEAIRYNHIGSYEVIYVDSKSKDDSIERARKFNSVKIFRINGICNAAIARNVGAKESSGDSLFFIDGDMEIEPSFLGSILNKDGRLIYECVTGHLDDLFYDKNGVFLNQIPRTYDKFIPKNNIELATNGGNFVIKKENWILAKGMRTKYRRCQDLDFTIRLAYLGIRTIRVPFLISKHHTIDYRNDKRMWNIMFSGDHLFSSLLFRDHISNIKVVMQTLRSHYTSFMLVVLLIAIFISKSMFLFAFSLYLTFLIIKVFLNTLKAASLSNKLFYFLQRLLLQFLRDILFLYAILFFSPGEKKIEYTRVV